MQRVVPVFGASMATSRRDITISSHRRTSLFHPTLGRREVTSVGVEVVRADGSDREQWNSIVERSPHGTLLHRYEALEVLATHSNTRLHPLIGYVGEEPIGVFPLFELSKGPLTAVFSPPPDLKVHHLGPALVNFEKLKRRKADKRNQRFIESCLDVVSGLDSQYTNVRTDVRYTDVRPFAWNGFDVTTRYTYVIDLTLGADELLARFNSEARSNIRREYDVDYEIREGNADAIPRIIDHVKARHEEKGKTFPVTTAFVKDLYERLPAGTIRPYVCTVDGQFAGGHVVFNYGDTVFTWVGAAKHDVPIPVNDLLEWRVISDGIEGGLRRYDLAGANNPHLCTYKAKFAPDIERYQEMRKTPPGMDFLTGMYGRVRNHRPSSLARAAVGRLATTADGVVGG